MPAFPREEIEETMRRWVAANDKAGETGDWAPMGDFYTEDAMYTWNMGHKYEFCARGIQEIRDWVFGTEMDGLGKWTYPYVRVLIDADQGEAVGFWRQIAPLERPDGSPYEIAGTGGSWFRYGGDYKWAWQRDFFDHGNAGVIFGELMQNGQLPEAMQERMKAGSRMPGWTKRADFDWYATLDSSEK